MNELKLGTFVMMVKNEDGSFSPVGMNKEQAYIVLACGEPFMVQTEHLRSK